MANACVFCGDDSRRLTDEHVFADWISEFFQVVYGKPLGGVAQLVNAEGGITQYTMIPFQQVVKIVCEKCNTGWMRRLEDGVQAVLKRMMLGQPTRLRPETQMKLATWAVKTALVLDHLQPAARVIPDAHYSSFHAQQRPLRTHFVLISHRSVPRDNLGELLGMALKQPVVNIQVDTELARDISDQIERWVQEGHRMYKVTFAVGQFVALVFGHDFPLSVQISGNAPAERI
jgi:hypothetical protein